MKILLEFYNNFRPCLVVVKDEEVFGKLSINVVKADLPPDEFILKTYSENVFWAQDLVDRYPDWFIPTGKTYKLGYSVCPIYRLSAEYISQEFEKTYNRRTDIYEASTPLWNLYHEICDPVQNDKHQPSDLGDHS